MDPTVIATLLRELAVYYELDGDRHRAFAYDRASRSIEAAAGLHRLIEDGRLEDLPGVGPSIARVVAELARRGKVDVLEGMRAKWPVVVVELAQLPAVGVPKARKLHHALAPADLDAVAAACRAGRVAELAGFGKVSEQKLLAALEDRRLAGTRVLLVDAERPARALADYLRADPAATRVELCGPMRRWSEIVDHLAYAVATLSPARIVERLASYPLVSSVGDRDVAPGEPVVVTLAGGLRVEVRITAPARLGWAQLRATGSTDHVDALRARASDRSIVLDTLAAEDEAAVYAALGLPWMPPEVRDGTDELAAAARGDDFHDLITLADLTTATHCHTTHSDGTGSIEDMARAAAQRGFDAITITDHSAAASYAGGLDLPRLRAQRAEIETVNASLTGDGGVRVLHGTEADILADGAIDVPAPLLPELEVIIASVHQRFRLDEDAMTARLVAAMRQPFFKIWGHALGRLVLRRDPIPVRIDDVLDAAAGSAAAIELNGDPHRLDLDPVNARRAAARGIRFVLSSDAHSVAGLDATRFAVGMARRARIRKQQVLNALPVDAFVEAIRPAR